MSRKRKLVSIIVMLLSFIGVYLLLRQGATSVSEIGTAIATILIGLILTVLWWGFRKDIERWLERPKSSKEELDLLIKPLYLAFDKYKDWTPLNWEINIKIFEFVHPGAKEVLKYKGLTLAFSILFKFGPNGKFLESLGSDQVDSVIGILQLYGELAQPQLRELIKQYFELRQKSEKSEEGFWSDSNFINIYGIFNRMDALIKKRYDELMWGKKES